MESAVTNRGTSHQEGRIPSVVVTIIFLFVQLHEVSDNETSVRVEVRFNCISHSHKTLTKQEATRKLTNKKVKIDFTGVNNLEEEVLSSDQKLLETSRWEAVKKMGIISRKLG